MLRHHVLALRCAAVAISEQQAFIAFEQKVVDTIFSAICAMNDENIDQLFARSWLLGVG